MFVVWDRCSISENPSKSVDGIVGLGRGNASILSQLASSGKVKKVFSHCLSGHKGGGIFAVGEVVDPKVNRTPLVPNEYVMSTLLFVISLYPPFILNKRRVTIFLCPWHFICLFL